MTHSNITNSGNSKIKINHVQCTSLLEPATLTQTTLSAAFLQRSHTKSNFQVEKGTQCSDYLPGEKSLKT